MRSSASSRRWVAASTRPSRWSTHGSPMALGSSRAPAAGGRRPAVDDSPVPGVPLDAAELVARGTWSPPLRDFLARAVRARLNILVSGGTGSGKTTTLGALSSFIAAGDRIVTIEDTAELRLQQPHVLRLEARPPNVEGRGEITIRHLLRNALRMRPDRIVVGEFRGGEALEMLAAILTGHDGSLSTVHAGSPAEALRRVETLALMADVDLPLPRSGSRSPMR